MSEPASALGGAVSEGFARVEEMPPRGMIALRGDLGSGAVKAAVKDALSLDLPGTWRATDAGEAAVCWMAPDELLLMSSYAQAPEIARKLGHFLAGEHHLVADMSDARSLFRVTGLDAREALAKLTPADLSPGAFTPGTFRRTRLAQVPAAIWMRDDTVFEVLCFRSAARYMFDLLTEAAARGGEVGFWPD